MSRHWTLPTVVLATSALVSGAASHAVQEVVGVTLTSPGAEPRAVLNWLATTDGAVPAPMEWEVKKALSMRRTFAVQGARDAVADSTTDTAALLQVSMEPGAAPGSPAQVQFKLMGVSSGMVPVKAGVAGARVDTSAKSAKVNALVSKCAFGVPVDAVAGRMGEAAWSFAIDASIPEADQAATKGRLAAYRTLVLDVWPVFPAEAVGVGATWRQVEQRLIRDSIVWVVTTWTLTGREGDRLTLELSRELDAPPPPGGSALLHYEQEATVRVSLEDPRLLGATMTERMATRKAAGAQGGGGDGGSGGGGGGGGGGGALLDVDMTSSATVTVEPRRPAAPTASGGT